MKIKDYFKHQGYVVAFDNKSYIHWIQVSELYRFLIDNYLLDFNINTDKYELTFDEWLLEKDLACIDLATFLEAKELKKKIFNAIDSITKTHKPCNNQQQSQNWPKA